MRSCSEEVLYTLTTENVRLIPLGGLGEVGKNMMVVEYGDDIMIIDSGSMFPDDEMFGATHSFPDATALAINPPIGTIVHTGDYKSDHTPTDGRPADFGTLARLGNEGVLVMMGDSTRVETPGYTPSERVINDSFDKIFANAPARIIIATFASLLSRVHQVVHTPERSQRWR